VALVLDKWYEDGAAPVDIQTWSLSERPWRSAFSMSPRGRYLAGDSGLRCTLPFTFAALMRVMQRRFMRRRLQSNRATRCEMAANSKEIRYAVLSIQLVRLPVQ
jgi:hypothetical protein